MSDDVENWQNYKALALVITAELPIESDKAILKLANKASNIFAMHSRTSIVDDPQRNSYLPKRTSLLFGGYFRGE